MTGQMRANLRAVRSIVSAELRRFRRPWTVLLLSAWLLLSIRRIVLSAKDYWTEDGPTVSEPAFVTIVQKIPSSRQSRSENSWHLGTTSTRFCSCSLLLDSSSGTSPSPLIVSRDTCRHSWFCQPHVRRCYLHGIWLEPSLSPSW